MKYKGFTLRQVKSKSTRQLYIMAQKNDKIIAGDWSDTKEKALTDIKDKMNTIYNQSLFDEIVSLQASIAQATDYAAGVLLSDLGQLLKEYATAQMVIYRCNTADCHNDPFWVTDEQLPFIDKSCQICQQPFDRLLGNGEWQPQVERDQLNQVEYQKVRV